MENEKQIDLDINLLDLKKLCFKVEDTNFLSLVYDEKEYKQIIITRIFPETYKEKYISVQDKDKNEIGIIADVNKLDEKSCELIKNELSRRYFCYEITTIRQIKEKMGYLYFDVILKNGEKSFAVKEASKNVKRVNRAGKILICDIDGNRYEIGEYEKLTAREKKLIIPYLF
ncbi:MAG: DUF1854 domain-containing protein [Clostridia bacterium]